MKLISFMHLWDLQICFKFGVIGVSPRELSAENTEYGNFHQYFWGPLMQKLWVGSEKFRGCKNGTDVLMHAKFGGHQWMHGDRR